MSMSTRLLWVDDMSSSLLSDAWFIDFMRNSFNRKHFPPLENNGGGKCFFLLLIYSCLYENRGEVNAALAAQ